VSPAELAAAMGESMEKLEGVENAYNVVRRQARRLSRFPLVSSIHRYSGFTVVTLSIKQAKKIAAELTRACLAVQHAHHYFTQTLKLCDEVRSTGTSRALIGAMGGSDGINEMTKKIQYGSTSLLLLFCIVALNHNNVCIDSVKMAAKAQVCLDEMFRVMEPHVHMLPAERMEDYKALKQSGLMQMSKIYNLMWGGTLLADGVSGQRIP
jgi:hypothetical protein